MPKTMKVDQHSDELRKGAYNTPVKKGSSPSGPSVRRMLQDDRIKDLDFRDEVASIDSHIITKATLDRYRIEYVLEAIAQIIAVKLRSKSITLWTPFGDCTLCKMSPSNFLVIAEAKHMTRHISTTYSSLLDSLERHKNNHTIKKNIVNFLCAKVDNRFYIDTSTGELSTRLNICLKNYNRSKLAPNPTAAAMCGIFISEMIRSSGKVVRAAFRSSWPKTYDELSGRFILASKGGAGLFRRYLQDPKSVSPKVAEAANVNVALFSPANKRQRTK